MDPVSLDLFKEINLLWEPVYPYLARAIREDYGRREGTLVEIGPFCGVIFELGRQGIGDSFAIAAFPQGMANDFRKQARQRSAACPVRVIETNSNLDGLEENSVDLAIFRGALFFPSLFEVDWSAIHRVLKPDGVALIGGGFGKFTPQEVVSRIGQKSRELNLQLGKVEMSPGKLQKEIEKISLKATFEILREGGLWVLMKKDQSH
jgi:hypothetical protein